MLPNHLSSLTTAAGTISLGCSVYSTRYANVEGPVTAIRTTPTGPTIEVLGRHSDFAQYYRLLAEPAPEAVAINEQATTPVISGTYEVRLPGESDRVYFAQTVAEVIALLNLKIGVAADDVAYATERIERATAAGKCDDIRFRGSFGFTGQLAYVSTGKERAAPLFAIGDKVLFFKSNPVYTVSGIRLYYDDRRQYGATTWQYEYAESRTKHYAMREHDTQAAPV